MTVPSIPHTPCTLIAPTGSSILHFLSMNSTASTITIPHTRPINAAPAGLTISQPAVIPTSPAKAPLSVIDTSGFLYLIHVKIIVVTLATAALKLVFINILPARAMLSPSIFTVEQPLKPNQQNHKMNTPSAPITILCPGIALEFPSLSYFPMRAPSILAPTKAATPPTICTAVEPAKSWNPSCASQPPPHIQ